jgi:hypothetical protein
MGEAARDAKVLMIDGSPLIPTIAIKTGQKAQPWVFGQQAAQLSPGKGMTVFQNWKAKLFIPNNSKDSAEAAIVAAQFFDWLRERVTDAGVPLDSVQVRVALPAFRNSEEIALIIARCMEMSDWDSPLILRATEPHANVLGLFSSGCNVSIKNAAGTVRLHYGKTFDFQGPYVQAARSFVLSGNRANLFDALIIDIGAFTVDFAAMTFDFDAMERGDGLKLVREESHALGVANDLDRMLFAELGKQHQFDPSALSFSDRELLKQALYRGEEYTLLVRGQGRIRLGTPTDQATVETLCKNFAAKVWALVEQFLAEGRKPSIAFITGGGVNILPVAEQLDKFLAKRKVRVAPTDDSPGATGQAEWRVWRNTGEGLHRIATAIGGASIVLQDTSEPPPESRPVLVEAVPVAVQRAAGRREPVLVPCRCQGGNKDCCFCGGRGQYFRP